MADKNWKRLERDVAGIMSNIVGYKIERNSCKENADNSERNSDVDVRDVTFSYEHKEGITYECKYSSSKFKSLYKFYKAHKTKEDKLIVINERILLYDVHHTDKMLSFLFTYRSGMQHLTEYDIVRVQSNLAFKNTFDALDQAARYAENKNLIPLVAIRKKKEHILGVADLKELSIL